MVGWESLALTLAAFMVTLVSIFLVLPQGLERLGIRSASVRGRAIVWAVFASVMAAVAVAGPLREWFLGGGWPAMALAIAIAFLWDVYRLKKEPSAETERR